MLVDGIEVEARQPDGTIRGERVRLIDFDTPENNDWLAVNQFTVEEKSERRPGHRAVYQWAAPIRD